MLVYILKQNGQPFMPTKRFGKVRRLLKAKKAKVVRKEPFTIKLLCQLPTTFRWWVVDQDEKQFCIEITILVSVVAKRTVD